MRTSFAYLCMLLAVGCDDSGSATGSANATFVGINSTDAEVGKTGTLRLSFDNPVGSDTDVAVTSSTPGVATVPDHVTVPKGALAAEIAFSAVAVGTTTFYGTVGSVTQTVSAEVVDAFRVRSLDADSNAMEQGANTVLYVYLNATPPEAVTVDLTTSDASIITVPSTVVVSPWNSNGRAPLTALAVGTTSITATLGESSASGTLTVVDHARLVRGYSFGSQIAEVGLTLTGSVSTDAIVAMPTAITTTSSDASVVAAPANVVVPAGTSSANFDLPLIGAGQTSLGFTLADSSFSVPITAVAAAKLALVRVDTPIPVGSSASGTVQLDALGSSPHQIDLASSDPTILAVPSQVTVGRGQSQTDFALNPLKAGTVTITASFAGSTQHTLVYVGMPYNQLNLYWNSSHTLALGAEGTLQVNSNAQTAQLTSSDPTVIAVPSTVTIPYGNSNVRLTALKAGTTTITATTGTLSDSIDLLVVTAADIQIGPTFSLPPNSTTSGNLQFTATVPTGTQVSFASSNGAVLAAPPPVVLGSSDDSVSFVLSSLASGTAILTATAMGVSKSAVVYVGTDTQVPPYLWQLNAPQPQLEIGAATYVIIGFSDPVAADVPVMVVASPAPGTVVSVAEANPVMPAGEQTLYVPVVAKSAGSAVITASAGGVSRTVGMTVLDHPTFSMPTVGPLTANSAAVATINSDCQLAYDRTFSVTSSDDTAVSVAPATVTLSPGSNYGQFVVKGLTPSTSPTVTATLQGMPSPSPAPLTMTITVN